MVKQGLFMKRYLLVVLSSSMFIAGHAYGQQSAEARLNAMFDTKAKTVYVAAHRGDWRNAPEKLDFESPVGLQRRCRHRRMRSQTDKRWAACGHARSNSESDDHRHWGPSLITLSRR